MCGMYNTGIYEMCKASLLNSPRSPKMQPNLYWVGIIGVHART